MSAVILHLHTVSASSDLWPATHAAMGPHQAAQSLCGLFCSCMDCYGGVFCCSCSLHRSGASSECGAEPPLWPFPRIRSF
jgi:hypothetical protein